MKTTRLLILLTSLLALASCGDDEQIIPAPTPTNISNTGANENRNTTGPTEARTRYEFPKLKGGDNTIIVHKATLNDKTGEKGVNYCVEWDPTLRSQRWSCYQLHRNISRSSDSKLNVGRYNADNDGSLSSICQYPNDPELAANYPFTADPFKYSGYDHGHICPSADRQRATEANYQTFFITNMQPQYNKFNAGLWEKMEEDVRTWANEADTLYVCKGGTIDSPANILEYVNQNNHQQTRTSNNLIPVPRYFFMAVLSKNGSELKALGYWVRNLNENHENDNRQGYAISIDKLEDLTGIDFFCNLPDDIEKEVEQTLTLSKWSFK